MTAQVAGSPVNLASGIAYLPFGPMTGMTYGNALTFSAAYDQDYNPTNRTVSGGIYNNAYDTDDNGNIIQIGSTDYAYDALNRLDEEDSGSAVTYTYDATANRLTKVNGGTVTTTVPGTSNKISAVGANAYTYDAAGNITADGTNTYTWNAAGQLGSVNTTGGVYTYDSQNRRTKKVAGGVTTHYVYGAGGLLYGEYDTAGDFIREYVYLDSAPLAQVDAGTPEAVTYLHPDHLGTPRYGTDAGGTQVWAWAGDAFGVGAPSGAATVNIRMPGQYADAESGLFYNWNRYYNPAIGRYISSDPIGLEGGMNTFLYAEASPVMYVDATGEAVQLVLGAGYVGYVGYRSWQVGRALAAAKRAADIARAARVLSMVSNDPNAKAAENASSAIQEKTCPSGDPNDPDESPKIQDLQKVSSNKEANRVAQEYGYKDAHDAKNRFGRSLVNIYKDKSTGKYYIWDGKAMTEPQPF